MRRFFGFLAMLLAAIICAILLQNTNPHACNRTAAPPWLTCGDAR